MCTISYWGPFHQCVYYCGLLCDSDCDFRTSRISWIPRTRKVLLTESNAVPLVQEEFPVEKCCEVVFKPWSYSMYVLKEYTLHTSRLDALLISALSYQCFCQMGKIQESWTTAADRLPDYSYRISANVCSIQFAVISFSCVPSHVTIALVRDFWLLWVG